MIGDRCTNISVAADIYNATQNAPSFCCRAPLSVTVLPFPAARFPGEVRYTCSNCGQEETAAMRAEKRVGGCHYCGGFMPPKAITTGAKRLYCGADCRTRAANERKLARRRAMSKWRREQSGSKQLRGAA